MFIGVYYIIRDITHMHRCSDT